MLPLKQNQCPVDPVSTAEMFTQTESSESAIPDLQEVSTQAEAAVLAVESLVTGGIRRRWSL